MQTNDKKYKNVLREATRKDRVGMKQLNEKCLKENYDMNYWENIISFHNSFVICASGVVVAYILCDNECTIISLAVDESFRNQGFGKRLLLRCIESSRQIGLEKLILHVRPSNEYAIRLYESCGFIVSNTLEKYYDDGENANEMYIDLI